MIVSYTALCKTLSVEASFLNTNLFKMRDCITENVFQPAFSLTHNFYCDILELCVIGCGFIAIGCKFNRTWIQIDCIQLEFVCLVRCFHMIDQFQMNGFPLVSIHLMQIKHAHAMQVHCIAVGYISYNLNANSKDKTIAFSPA